MPFHKVSCRILSNFNPLYKHIFVWIQLWRRSKFHTIYLNRLLASRLIFYLTGNRELDAGEENWNCGLFFRGEQWQSGFVANQHSIGFHYFSLQPVFLKVPIKFKTITYSCWLFHFSNGKIANQIKVSSIIAMSFQQTDMGKNLE